MKYTKESLSLVIKNSLNWAEVCRHFNVPTKGGSPYHIKEKAIKYEIDFSHFTGRSREVSKNRAKISVADYIKYDIVKSHRLRLKLIEEGIKEEKCEYCLATEWMGEKIPLDLDHIDGNHFNNELNNLRILCKNCHALTGTYGSKKLKKERFCEACDAKIDKRNKYCLDCRKDKERNNAISSFHN